MMRRTLTCLAVFWSMAQLTPAIAAESAFEKDSALFYSLMGEQKAQLLSVADAKELKAKIQEKVKEARACVDQPVVFLRGVFANENLLWPLNTPYIPAVIELCGTYKMSVDAAGHAITFHPSSSQGSSCETLENELRGFEYQLCGHASALSSGYGKLAKKLAEAGAKR